MIVVDFPEQRDRRPVLEHPHPAVQREAQRIENWLAHAQHTLSKLAGVEPEHHKVLRRLADELVQRLLDDAA